MKTRLSGWLGLLWVATGLVVADEPEAKKLTPEESGRLARDGFCVSGEPCGSMAEVYLLSNSGVPVLITSDSVLAKFHWLLRETMAQRDPLFTVLLTQDLKRGWQKLEQFAGQKPEGNEAVCRSALRRARIVCGTALALLEPAWQATDPELNREIAAETARVTAAKEKAKPAWLGPPEPCFSALDYPTCKPVGRFAENPESARYFRVVRFLQMIPFRLSRQDELFSACYLLSAVAATEGKTGLQTMAIADSAISAPAMEFAGAAFRYRKFDETMPLRSGLGDTLAYQVPTLGKYPHLIQNLIATQAMAESDLDTRMAVPLAFPDAVLFQRVMDRFLEKGWADRLPDSLLVAGWLGDPQAVEAARSDCPEIAEILVTREMSHRKVSWPEHLPMMEFCFDALQALMSGPEEGVPEFMRKDAWRLKTRQTVLASWARTRNCFALEAPGSTGIGGGPKETPGFVEPCPDFYQRLGRVAQAMEEYCRRHATAQSVADWSRLETVCSRLAVLAHKQLRGIDWNEIDRKNIGEYGFYMLNTCDDKPRVAAVARSGVTQTTLIAAAGPHRVLWVNYPWKGREILCKGAVMTFHSFTTPGPLSDEEWAARLRATPAPQPPEWLKQIMPGEGK